MHHVIKEPREYTIMIEWMPLSRGQKHPMCNFYSCHPEPFDGAQGKLREGSQVFAYVDDSVPSALLLESRHFS